MLKSSIFNLTGHIVRVLSSLLSIPILINYMGLELYGYWSWSTSILTIVQLSEAGLSSGLLYYLSKHKGNKTDIDKTLTSSILLLCASIILSFFIVLILAPISIEYIVRIKPEQLTLITSTLKAGSLLVSLRIFQSLFWSILQSEQKYFHYNIYNTAQVLFNNVLWGLLAFYNIKHLPVYIYSSTGVSTLISIILIRVIWPSLSTFKWSFNIVNLRLITNYNIGIFGSSIGSAIFTQGDKLLIANILGPIPLAIYTVYTSLCTQLNHLISQVIHPIIPLITSHQNNLNSDQRYLKIKVSNTLVINIYLSLIGASILIAFSEQILSFFLKNSYQSSLIKPFCLLALIYGVYTLAVTGYYILIASGKK